ncbi:MAG TPA: histidine kinase [Flavisolibacter sp.]|nr:histidine kinase [Flavisolibacter sp.]
MHSSSYYLSLLFHLFIFLPGGKAQAQYKEQDFVRLTVKDGLTHNNVMCFQQDDLGYIWIGTQMGVNRYDGKKFRNFLETNQQPSLNGGLCHKLKKMGHHKLGILARYGFQLLNTKDLSIKNYFIPDSTPFVGKRNAVWDAVSLPDGSVVLSTAAGFYLLNKQGEIKLRHDAYGLGDVSKRRIHYGRDIFPLADKKLAVYVEEDKLASFDIEKNKFIADALHENDLYKLYPPEYSSKNRWIRKFQLNSDEFIFFCDQIDSVMYYHHGKRKSVMSKLPFSSHNEISWESNLQMLDENKFAVNSFHAGFFIFHLDRATGIVSCQLPRLLSRHRINTLFLDKDKRMWVGTNNGLLQQKLNRPLITSWLYNQPSYDNAYHGFQNALRYKDKLYLTRFSRFNGLVIIDTTTMKVSKRISFYGRDNMWNEIVSIQMYHPDTLWLATNAGILWFDVRSHRYGQVLDPKKYPELHDGIAVLAPAKSDGYAWFCFLLGGVAGRYHISSRTFTFFTSRTKPALPFDMVKSVVYDAYGDVWLGGHSLTRWNNQKQFFDTLIKVYGGDHKYNDDILTISADNTGSLWLHNVDNNLLEYRIKDKKFIQYGWQNGLPSSILHCLSPVVENTLWIGSPNHLTKLNTISKEMVVYDYTDGFPDEAPTGRRIYYDAETKDYYLFARNYLVKFNNRLRPTFRSDNPLLIEEVMVNNNHSYYHPSSSLRLTSKQNNLSLHYSIPEYENEDYTFAYKINGAKTWTQVGEERSIKLINLQEGGYKVEIVASGQSGKQIKQLFSFYIQPPFWKTPPFIVAIFVLFSALIYFFVAYRIKQIRQKADIDKMLAQTEMKALHAQMNPHFISNSLNSIREMILHNQNNGASHYITKFAHLIRVTLEQSTQPFITLRNTIDYLQRYVEMEQIRNSLFTCNITADESLDINETILPPMLIQPFIENAIWHGTPNPKRSININVCFKKENDQLICIIEDDGMGIEKSLKDKNEGPGLKQSVGISNIKKRILLLNEKYKLQSSIVIEDKSVVTAGCKTGTVVKLKLPVDLNA